MAVFISDKIDFKTRNITASKAVYFIILKRSNNQDYIIITNVYGWKENFKKHDAKTNRIQSRNIQIPNYSWKYQHSSPSNDNKINREKISKGIYDVKNAINQLNLINIYIALHPIPAFNAHGTVTNLDHILNYKTYLNKLKITEIIQFIFYEHKGIKLKIDDRMVSGKP